LAEDLLDRERGPREGLASQAGQVSEGSLPLSSEASWSRADAVRLSPRLYSILSRTNMAATWSVTADPTRRRGPIGGRRTGPLVNRRQHRAGAERPGALLQTPPRSAGGAWRRGVKWTPVGGTARRGFQRPTTRSWSCVLDGRLGSPLNPRSASALTRAARTRVSPAEPGQLHRSEDPGPRPARTSACRRAGAGGEGGAPSRRR
jgi:hypothetical protein